MDTHLREALTAVAHDTGFHVVRFAAVRPTPRADALDRWLARGQQADMHWLARQREVRRDPRVRAPWARTAMVLAVHHHHARPPDPGGRTGLVARYAWGRDYHNLMGKRLRKLLTRLRRDGRRAWGGVDTAPIQERSWAAAAGLGFTGKHTLQIEVGRTSWMLLGVVMIDAEVTPDAPLRRDHCGSCQRCLDICPTEAFRGPWDLDARACIAYWTIEARGVIPRSLRPRFGRWVFGCDLCQEACPHNHAPPEPDEPDLLPRNAWLDLDALLRTPDAALLDRFTGTPLRRPGAAGLKRNALVVLGNLGDDGAVDAIREALEHPSPVVRATAVWALDRLGAPTPLTDPDPAVRAEIQAIRRPKP
ncbi:MAG: tRNA epoxyqueuosine(34) reductase QueG [Myxococcota bacterium]